MTGLLKEQLLPLGAPLPIGAPLFKFLHLFDEPLRSLLSCGIYPGERHNDPPLWAAGAFSRLPVPPRHTLVSLGTTRRPNRPWKPQSRTIELLKSTAERRDSKNTV